MQDLLSSTAELVRDREYDRAARVLADCANGDATNGVNLATVEALHQLCVVAAEHSRLAGELEIAARHHRVAEQELLPVLKGILARWTLGPGGWSGAPVGHEGVADRRRPTRRPPTRMSSALANALEVRMLGPLEVRVGERHLGRWGNLKARAVFQYLVYHHERPIRRDVLMETFWPGYTHSSARNNLNVALYNLRRTLFAGREGQYVLYGDGCYFLDPMVQTWIDRDAFVALQREASAHVRAQSRVDAAAALAELVALYRGPLFEDDTTSEWHLPAQRHLEDAYLQALEQLGELQLAAGDVAAAEQVGEQALETDPCRESAHRLLMRCYASRRQHHLITRQLHICGQSLSRDLGAAPAAETTGLARELTSAAADPARREDTN